MLRKFLIISICALAIITIATNVKAYTSGEEIREYSASVKYVPVSKFAEDNKNRDFYSITYQIYKQNLEIIKYEIRNIYGFPEGSYVADVNTGEKKTEFGKDDTRFKIMIPKESARLKDFIGEMFVSMEFRAIRTEYNEKGEISAYYQTDTNEQLVQYEHRLSIMRLQVIDKEEQKAVEGVKIKVQVNDGIEERPIELITNQYGEITVEPIGRGNLVMEVISAPEEYDISNIGKLQFGIGHNENSVRQLYLTHKKGKLCIEDNAKATFEIYNSSGKLVGTYSTDEDGKIEIEDMNSGKYLLIQRDVEEGYIKTDNMLFTIEGNETCTIGILNQLINVSDGENEEENNPEQLPEDNDKQEEVNQEENKPEQLPEDNDKQEEVNQEENKPEQLPEDNKQEEVNQEENKPEQLPEDNDKQEDVNQEENKPEQLPEDDKQEDVNQEEDELEQLPEDKEEITQNTQNKSEDNDNILPRTGDDYFLIKLIFLDLVAITIFIIAVEVKKKQTAKKQSVLSENLKNNTN